MLAAPSASACRFKQTLSGYTCATDPTSAGKDGTVTQKLKSDQFLNELSCNDNIGCLNPGNKTGTRGDLSVTGVLRNTMKCRRTQ